MVPARSFVVAIALLAAGTMTAGAQGWGWGPGSGQGCGWAQGCARGGGYGPGSGWGRGSGYGPGYGYGRGPGWRQAGGPCVTGQAGPCWRIQNPEKHATCWKEADAKGLRAWARRSFMTSCMTTQ
jgi:hypothetical protein